MAKKTNNVSSTEPLETVEADRFYRWTLVGNPDIRFSWAISNVSAWIANIKQQGEWNAFSPIFPSEPSPAKWKLLFRIEKDHNDEEKISLYLCPMSGRKKCKILFIFLFYINLYSPFVGKDIFYFTPEDEFLGYELFYDLNTLIERSGLLGNKISFNCYLTIVEEEDLVMSSDGIQRMHVANAKLNADMGKLLEMDKFGDVELVVGNRTFTAYKGILAARSSVFAEMFNRPRNRFKIEDTEPEVFQELLRYIYTDQVPNIEAMKFQLLAVAHRFKIECLKQLCQAVISSKDEDSPEDFAAVLKAGSTCDAPMVKKHALEMIVKGPVGFTRTPAWKELVSAYPHLADEAIELLAMRAKDIP